MISKKLHSIIDLIKDYGPVDSVNELGRLCEGKEKCCRKTVYNLLPQIQDHESIDFNIVDGQDTFTYVEAAKRTYSMENELANIDSIINDLKIILEDFNHLPKKLSNDRKLSIVNLTIVAKRKIIRAQQRMVHFEACGFRTNKTREKFDQTKARLSKIDLDIHKKVFTIDRETVGKIWVKFNQEFSGEAFRESV